MSSTKGKVIVNSALYTVGNILLKVFTFLLIPLYTAYLSPEQYGMMNLAMAFSNVAGCLIMCGLQFAVIRFYAHYKSKTKAVALMFGTVISFVSLLGLIVGIVLFCSSGLWIKVIFDNIPFFPIVLLAILLSVVTGLYTIYQDILKGMQKAKKSVLLSYVYFFLLLGSNIFTVVYLRLGASGILLSVVLVNLIMIVIMIRDLWRSGLIIIGISRKLLIKLLKYALPLVPHTLAYNVSAFFTRILINSKMSTSMLGLYTLASQFGGVADVVSNSVQSAFQPWLYEKLTDVEKGNDRGLVEIRQLTHQLLWLYGGIYLLIGAWAQEVIDFMSSDAYHSAWKYVPLLIMNVAIKSPLYFFQNFFYYNKGKTYYIFVFTLIGSAFSMLFAWFLIPIWGIWGAILGDGLAMLIRISVTIILGRKMIDEVYSISRICFITSGTIIWLGITILPSYFHIFEKYYLDMIYKLLCILVYGIVAVIVYKESFNSLRLKIMSKWA